MSLNSTPLTTPTVTGSMPDLDALAAASRERGREVYEFKYLGVVWHATYSVPFGKLLDAISEDSNIDQTLETIAYFLIPEEREHFVQAIRASEEVTITELGMLSKFFNEKSQEAVGNDAS